MKQWRGKPHLVRKGLMEEAAVNSVLRVGREGFFSTLIEERKGITSRLVG